MIPLRFSSLKNCFLVGFTILVALAALPARAQTTFATITGTITDQSGAAIPGAEIEITQIETNYVYSTVSNESGQYTVANLRDGSFRLNARSPGFQDFQVDDIVLTGRQTRRIDVSLVVGAVDTVIEVTAGASLLETESAAIADTKDREVLRALPLTLRRAWDYFTLTPTVERTSSWHISIAGSHNNQSVAAIDGTPINAADGGTGIGPLMDRTESLKEMRIDMAQGSADQATPGQVTLISRAGSNDFHGALSDYYSTPAFRARNTFQNTRSTVRSHLLTLSAGGPILIPKIYNGRDKTFFFFTYEGNFGSAGQAAFNNGVPLQSWRNGDFSNVGQAITDPFNGGATFANNMIPSSRLNPVAKAIQDQFYPLPNFGDGQSFTTNNYRELRNTIRPPNPQITSRFDHRISNSDFFYVRWTAVRWNLNTFDTTAPTITEMRPRSRNMDAITAAHTHTFSPSVMNEFRYGFTRQDFPQEAIINGPDVVNSLGLQGLAPDLPDVGGIHRVAFQGLGITELSVTDACKPCSRHRIHNFTNNVNWYRGDHSFRFGWFGSYSQNSDLRQAATIFGRTTYSNRFTGFAYSDFLLGTPTTMERAFTSIGRDNSRWSHAAYFTDEWKVLPKLTVTMGLRWDMYLPWTESNNQMAIFDIDAGDVVVPDGALAKVSPALPTGFVPIVEAGQAGRPNTLVKTDWDNLAPRFGVAWRPFGEKTVLRGGFGVYYDTAPWQPSSGAAPFVLNEPAFTNPQDSPLVLPTVFPAGGGGSQRTFTLPDGIRANLQMPYTLQYSATVEHQRWDTNFRLSYTGTGTRQGIYRYNVNQPAPDDQLFINKARRFTAYPDILYTDNGAGHQYHGMTFEVERRMKKGLHFQGYYTWAKDIGDLERGQSPENALNRARETTNWERMANHRVTSNVIWQLPVGNGRKWLQDMHPVADAVFGGWELSGIYTYETGRWIQPLWTGPDPTGTRFTTNATRPNVTLRPDALRDSRLDNPTPDQWFDPSAFAAPGIGRFGTAGKYIILGPGTNVLHGSIAKHFMVKERVRIRLEMLASNALNHPNYQDPDTNISQLGSVGRITQTVDRNIKLDSAITRELQAQIRIEW
ncbi:MAG: hypothetical protein GC160_03980 [Acidobacteria bacterium]|nr:hypothetical protein [Acidobacteriota bacterium]